MKKKLNMGFSLNISLKCVRYLYFLNTYLSLCMTQYDQIFQGWIVYSLTAIVFGMSPTEVALCTIKVSSLLVLRRQKCESRDVFLRIDCWWYVVLASF